MNSLIEIAKTKREEQYITPEDVTDAFEKGGFHIKIIRDLLQIMAKQTDYGIEDASLCAFIAWEFAKYLSPGINLQ